jgi:hypothetical protein
MKPLKEPHPGAQEAFNIRGKLPWHRQFLVKAKIDIIFKKEWKLWIFYSLILYLR